MLKGPASGRTTKGYESCENHADRGRSCVVRNESFEWPFGGLPQFPPTVPIHMRLYNLCAFPRISHYTSSVLQPSQSHRIPVFSLAKEPDAALVGNHGICSFHFFDPICSFPSQIFPPSTVSSRLWRPLCFFLLLRASVQLAEKSKLIWKMKKARMMANGCGSLYPDKQRNKRIREGMKITLEKLK